MVPTAGRGHDLSDDRPTALTDSGSGASRRWQGSPSSPFSGSQRSGGPQDASLEDSLPSWYPQLAPESSSMHEAVEDLVGPLSLAATDQTGESNAQPRQNQHSQQSDIASILAQNEDGWTPTDWQRALATCTTDQPAIARPISASLQMHAAAADSSQHAGEVDYAKKLREAIHGLHDQHSAVSAITSPVHDSALASCHSAPVPLANHSSARKLFPPKSGTNASANVFAPRRLCSAADTELDVQRPARRQASQAARFSPLPPSRQLKLSPSNSLPSRGPLASATHPLSTQQPYAQTPQAGLNSLPGQSSVLLDSCDSVPITPQHRRAWDSSHGSLQSFKAVRQALKHRQQQRLQAAELQHSKLLQRSQRPPVKPPGKTQQQQDLWLNPQAKAVSPGLLPQQLVAPCEPNPPISRFSTLSAPHNSPANASYHSPPQQHLQRSPYQPPGSNPHHVPPHRPTSPPHLLSSLANLPSRQQPPNLSLQTPVQSSTPFQIPTIACTASQAIRSLGPPPWQRWQSQPPNSNTNSNSSMPSTLDLTPDTDSAPTQQSVEGLRQGSQTQALDHLTLDWLAQNLASADAAGAHL